MKYKVKPLEVDAYECDGSEEVGRELLSLGLKGLKLRSDGRVTVNGVSAHKHDYIVVVPGKDPKVCSKLEFEDQFTHPDGKKVFRDIQPKHIRKAMALKAAKRKAIAKEMAAKKASKKKKPGHRRVVKPVKEKIEETSSKFEESEVRLSSINTAAG